MGIEVGQLDINMDVKEKDKEEDDDESPDDGAGACSVSKEEIVADCVREVLAVLKERQGR